MLARTLSTLHGFRCTVLFAVDCETGIVNPHVNTNIPGSGSLDDTDLMIILARWRVLPDDQTEPIDRFVMSGKPVIALRTATHASAPKPEVHRQVRAYLRNASRADDPESVPVPDIAPNAWSAYDHYDDGYTGPMEACRDGFGRLVVGERAGSRTMAVTSTSRPEASSPKGPPIIRFYAGLTQTESGVPQMCIRSGSRSLSTRCRWSMAR